MGKLSGSEKKVNFLPVYSSILMSSVSIWLSFKKRQDASMLCTPKAICLNPVDSGLDNLFGGFGKENSSIKYCPFKERSSLKDCLSSL